MTAVIGCTRTEAEQITARFRDAIGRVESSWSVLVATAIEAFQHRVWMPLGYSSWADYCTSEVGFAASRIPRDLRIEIVGQMSEAGMSTRAIGSAVGTAQDTVRRDLAEGERNRSPESESVPSLDHLDVTDALTGEHVVDIEFSDEGPFGFVSDDEPALTEEECEALADPEDLDDEPERITGMDGKSYPKPEPKAPKRKPITDAFWEATYDLGKKVTTLSNLAADDRFSRNADQLAEKNLNELIRTRDALQCVIDQLSD